MIHEMKLRDIYFDKIRCGHKIYEIRLNDEKRQMIDIGDIIIFKQDSDLQKVLNTVVVDLVYFDNFEDMAKTLPKEKVGFENENISQIIDIYHQFYKKEDEIKYGVVAIKINLIKERYSVCNN